MKFLGDDTGLWIVFDHHSVVNDAKPWYPVSRGITNSRDTSPGKAWLTNLYNLEHIIFGHAKHLVSVTWLPGEMQIDEVDRSEVEELKRRR